MQTEAIFNAKKFISTQSRFQLGQLTCPCHFGLDALRLVSRSLVLVVLGKRSPICFHPEDLAERHGCVAGGGQGHRQQEGSVGVHGVFLHVF